MSEDLLEKSIRLLKTWSTEDIQELLPELIQTYEKLDKDVWQAELNYDLYKIERYEHRKAKKNKWEIKRSDKEIEMESKKEALKKYWDQLLRKKISNHYKLNIEMLSQRKIDLAVENKSLREAWM